MSVARSGLRGLAHIVLDCVAVTLLPMAWVLRWSLLLPVRQQRISIWTGAPIITVARNAKAERLLGSRSVSVVRASYFITDEFDFDLLRMAGGSRAYALLLCYVAFLTTCAVADKVHAYTDGGLLVARGRRRFSPLELFAYRLMGIRLFIWTYGADIRTREKTLAFGDPNCCSECVDVGVACVCDDAAGAGNYARVFRSAAAVFSMGDMAEYAPGSRKDIFFWPIELESNNGERYRPVFPRPNAGQPLRVVHAPNHRQFKGTRHLENAVASLRQEGVKIELVMVEGVPNAKALEIYRSADVIFDQCLIGFHGYFALEAMALGKPVMCFIRHPERYLLHPEECPIINTHVATLEQDLREVVRRRGELEQIGRRGRSYVEKYFSPEAFAGRLNLAYRDLGMAA